MPTGESASPPTLGAALRAAREAAGASIEQVSAETRLRATVIRDLESDLFRSSGGTVYARGHVKSIARAVGADPEPLLALMPTAEVPFELAEPEPIPAPARTFGSEAFASAAAALVPERHGPRWGMALAGACAVLAAVLVIGYANQSSPASQDLTLPVVTPSQVAPTPAPSVVTAPDLGAVASKPEITGAQLRIRLIGGRSWVSVSGSDGQTLFEGTLRDGEFRDFSDPARLKILLGNARPVSLNCNGTDSGPAGSTGSVARFACTTEGLTTL